MEVEVLMFVSSNNVFPFKLLWTHKAQKYFRPTNVSLCVEFCLFVCFDVPKKFWHCNLMKHKVYI